MDRGHPVDAAGVQVDRTTALVLLKPAERVGHPMRLDHTRCRIHLERRNRLRLEELGKGRVTNEDSGNPAWEERQGPPIYRKSARSRSESAAAGDEDD